MGSGVIVKPLKSVCLQSESDWRQSRRFPPLGRLCFAFDPVNQIKRNTLQSSADFDRIARHFLALRLVFARFDPRQIGPRLPPAAPRTRRSSLKSCHWHDFRALITHGRRDSRASQTGAPRVGTDRIAESPLLAALRRQAIGSGVPPPGDRLSDPLTLVVSMPASRFGQTRKRPKATVLVPARLWVPLVSSWALPEPKPEFHPKAAALRHRRRPKPHPR